MKVRLQIVDVIASPSPTVILSEAKNLKYGLRINSAKQSHEVAEPALSNVIARQSRGNNLEIASP